MIKSQISLQASMQNCTSEYNYRYEEWQIKLAEI